MGAVQGSMLLVFTLIAIAALILMIARYKVYPFLVLMIVSVLLALAVGMPMDKIVKSFETGNGNTLGHIAVVVGLGTMLGKMMAESGGAERIAQRGKVGGRGGLHIRRQHSCAGPFVLPPLAADLV